jgi:tRNA(Ile)-lysidine synthase
VSFSSQHLLEVLTGSLTTRQLWIAYSGGLDSHVLLHALAQLRLQLAVELRAIHIHHGLRPQADSWATHCQQICQQLAIPCEIIRVKVRLASRESLEANARAARYQAIMQLLASNDIVVTAQHADDQAETLLLQLLRGAGVAGLAAMPTMSRLGKGWLCRPLLAYTRADLQAYAVQAKLQWIEDDSNMDTRFDRNFLRHEILPLLQQRWSSLNQVLSRVARHQAEANELMQELAKEDLQTCGGQQIQQLELPTLAKLSLARQRNVLRWWLKKLELPLPSTVQLQHILTDLVAAKADRQPIVRWQGGEVHRYQKHLFAMPNLPPLPTVSHCLNWKLPQILPLPWGELRARKVQGHGLILPTLAELQIRFRQGGETFHWHGHKRVVKKLLQTMQIPPWERPFLPFIYYQKQLVAIAKIGIHDHFIAQNEEEMGWEIEWHF